MKYRLYIDEVGNTDFRNCHNHNNRFLSLTGVILDIKHIQDIVHPQMEKLKRDFFDHHPDEPLILHRKDIVNAKPPFQKLKETQVQQHFNNALLGLLTTWDYTVITVCLDKRKHNEKYAAWKYEPYHYCLKILLERYLYFLDSMNATGDAMAESRGGREDMMLKKVYLGLYESGTRFVNANRFQARFTSKQLKIKAKTNNISGLQLADLIAHPSRNEILHQRGLLDRQLAPFAKEIIEILHAKYYVHQGNTYGKKFL